ncbi:tetratricopeptide repeat protein [Streptomyces pratensis]|uniref:tetratricopeptide repeat protein n=1 Tax=Streptomyces pratensis TaxID=1169025 RepID=UPI0030175302
MHVESGYGFGVIGADIHVFGAGVPLYVLEVWASPPPADPAFLRELPSRMLNARFGVVPFTGRHAELAELQQWRDVGPRLAVRWLHAPGGQGKTRLADEFAAASVEEGWKAAAATHGPGTVLPGPGSQDLRLDGAAGLLLVVDYADRWPLSHLTWLMSNVLLHRPGVRTRVLMLGRGAEGWPAMRAALGNHQAGTSSQQLTPLARSGPGGTAGGHRNEMFQAARAAFASCYGVCLDTGAPPALDDLDFGLTLTVHMAALVEVDARAAGTRPPHGLEALTVYLLDREHLHWENLYGDSAPRLGPPEQDPPTPPSVINRTVFAAALTGPSSVPTGVQALRAAGVPGDAHRVLADHARCYPPADPDRGTVLEPLYPDRLAEDFLALTLPGHRADYPARDWAGPTTSALLERAGAQAAVPWAPRAVTFLASAAARWPHVGTGRLYPMLVADPRLAMEAGNSALVLLAGLADIGPQVLAAVASAFPEHRVIDLDPGIARICQRLAPHRLAVARGPAERARVHDLLGARLFHAGLHDEALRATGTAVLLWADLERHDPGSHRQDYAAALSDLSLRLSNVGRDDEAVRPAQRAVLARRLLARAEPAAHEAALATALNTLGSALAGQGGRVEALGRHREAVSIYRRLVRDRPSEHEPGLAESLNGLAVASARVGRRRKALALQRESVEIYRRLSRAAPALYDADLASALHNLAVCHSTRNRTRQAAETEHEALEIRRRLARSNPASMAPELAGSYNNLAHYLMRLGDRTAALAMAEHAVEMYRHLLHERPIALHGHYHRMLHGLTGMLNAPRAPRFADEPASREAATAHVSFRGAPR